ncbi:MULTISPECIES: PhzF family phenazine biosynthesis isomerase [unclassified Deinococcus]|uniref:PhzF family phenazine biosynthesis isomerase n=1 Tax=unclassified Deinococcus TaxID=2623546 RepID=UPI001C2F195D|nr:MULTISPECIES: PhzF family phenazine biosynthesis isomerase [unclassified Deinococcus]MDK2011215.1 PhzF family phenazine biosynthesis isomerase [Deinococcus sp. 43]
MIAYSEVSAFTETPGHGNRAGVVLDAAHLSRQDMQALAELLGAPETVFITRREGTIARVRYFTPTQEVDFCGHATIALGFTLAQAGQWPDGQDLHLDTLVGRVPLRLHSEAGVPRRVWMRQPSPAYRVVPATLRADLAEALGIDHRMIHRGLPLAAASTGLWSVFVPLLDAVILDGLEPDLTRVHALSDALGVGSIYAYAPMGVNRFAARDFAPALGIPEDPVTGSAGGALMALLASQGRLPVRGERACGLVYQGHALGTPGEVEVELELDGQRVTKVHVGGCATVEREGVWSPPTTATR